MNPTALLTLLLQATSLALITCSFLHVDLLWPSSTLSNPQTVDLFSSSQGPLLFSLSLLAALQLLTTLAFGSFRHFYERYYATYIRKSTRRNGRPLYACYCCLFGLFCDDTDHFYQKKSGIFRGLILVQIAPIIFNLISLSVVHNATFQALTTLKHDYFSSETIGSFSVVDHQQLMVISKNVEKNGTHFNGQSTLGYWLPPSIKDNKMKKVPNWKKAASVQLIQATLGCCGLAGKFDYSSNSTKSGSLVDNFGHAWFPVSCCVPPGAEGKFDYFANASSALALCSSELIQPERGEVGCLQALKGIFSVSIIYYLLGAFVCQVAALNCSLSFFFIFY